MTSILAKRAIKRAAGLASVMLQPVTGASPQPSACILMYHRLSRHTVFDPWVDDWNVAPAAFDAHVAALAEAAEIVFLRDLPGRLAERQAAGPADVRTRKPLVCLTFDDGYRNFHDEALPVLRRHGAKATMFVVTGFIGSTEPMPFDTWGQRHQRHAGAQAWQPLGWRDIEACVDSGLVEFGGHSHRHANGMTCTASELREEAEQSRQVLRQRLGDEHAVCYAYPYGSTRLGHVTPEYIDGVKRSGYRFAVSTDNGLAHAGSNPYALPRVEVCRSDGTSVIRAKVAGSLAPFALTERLRRAHR